MEDCLSKKAEMPTSGVDPGDSLCFTSPLSLTVNSPTTPTTPPPPSPCPQIDPAALGNYVKSRVTQGFCIPRISIILGDQRISICFSKYFIFLVGCSKEGWLATQSTPPGSKLLHMCYQLLLMSGENKA